MGGTTGNLHAPLSQRGDDLYETPEVAVESLLRVENLPERIWEPACGPGAIARVLRHSGHSVWASDLVDYETAGQDAVGVDFLFETKLPVWRSQNGVGEADAIVTNPPFKLAQEFVAKALDLCPKVVMLLRLAFMESERRAPILDSGFLDRVYVYSKRLPMMHRAGWEGRKANSGMAFAWFIWDRNRAGALLGRPAELRRISWDKQ